MSDLELGKFNDVNFLAVVTAWPSSDVPVNLAG
jgi:hypothetical protein